MISKLEKYLRTQTYIQFNRRQNILNAFLNVGNLSCEPTLQLVFINCFGLNKPV